MFFLLREVKNGGNEPSVCAVHREGQVFPKKVSIVVFCLLMSFFKMDNNHVLAKFLKKKTPKILHLNL